MCLLLRVRDVGLAAELLRPLDVNCVEVDPDQARCDLAEPLVEPLAPLSLRLELVLVDEAEVDHALLATEVEDEVLPLRRRPRREVVREGKPSRGRPSDDASEHPP